MSESGPQIENRLSTSGYPDGDVENAELGPRWLIALLTATSLLIIVAVGSYFLLGRELFQRPFLIVVVVLAWLGALVGSTIGGDIGQAPQAEFLARRSDHTTRGKGGLHD